MAKKGDIPATEVVVGYSYVSGMVWITGPNEVLDREVWMIGPKPKEVLPDEIGRVDDDGLFIEVISTLTARKYYARHRFPTGGTIYALRAMKYGDKKLLTTKIWICTEGATTEETENDILQKVNPLYEGISLEAGSFKDLCEGVYAELIHPATDDSFTRREIRDSEGCYVGDITVIMLM